MLFEKADPLIFCYWCINPLIIWVFYFIVSTFQSLICFFTWFLTPDVKSSFYLNLIFLIFVTDVKFHSLYLMDDVRLLILHAFSIYFCLYYLKLIQWVLYFYHDFWLKYIRLIYQNSNHFLIFKNSNFMINNFLKDLFYC